MSRQAHGGFCCSNEHVAWLAAARIAVTSGDARRLDRNKAY